MCVCVYSIGPDEIEVNDDENNYEFTDLTSIKIENSRFSNNNAFDPTNSDISEPENLRLLRRRRLIGSGQKLTNFNRSSSGGSIFRQYGSSVTSSGSSSMIVTYLRNTSISNSKSNFGGAIGVVGYKVDNEIQYSVGIFIEGGSILNNQATNAGGAIYLSTVHGYIASSDLEHNTARVSDDDTVVNRTVTSNNATRTTGGAIHSYENALYVIKTTISDNNAGYGYGGG